MPRNELPNRRADPKSPGTRRLVWLAVAMAWVAGFVDAVGFLTLDRLYTTNMSGNTVALGFRATGRKGADALRPGWPVIASANILEAAGDRKLRSEYF